MIKKSQIKQACKVLQDVQEKFHSESKKINLLEDKEDSFLFLQVTLKKIPNTKSIKMIKVHMPHSLLKKSDEVCLITGDLDKKNHKAEIEPDILHYKELLKKHGITAVSEVVTLRQLRTDYKPYEAKQQLLAAYDVFLADKKIVECLPKVLGKHFFKKRKFPIQIDLKTANLKKQVENALSTKVFYVTGHGNSCCSEVAYLGMDNSDIIDNVMKVTNTLCDELPGSWNNVMGIYLKTSKSKAIPIFMSYDGFNDINIIEEKEISCIEGELSSLHNASVTVFSDGRVKSGRMIQNGEDKKEENDETSLSQEGKTEEDKATKKSKKSKKEKNMEPALIVLDEQQDSDEANSLTKKVKKARKKSTGLEPVLSELNNFEDSDPANSVSKKLKKSQKKSIGLEPELPELNNFEVSQEGKTADGKTTKKSKKSKKEKNLESALIVLDEQQGLPVQVQDSQNMEQEVSSTDGSQPFDAPSKAQNPRDLKEARTRKRKSKI